MWITTQLPEVMSQENILFLLNYIYFRKELKYTTVVGTVLSFIIIIMDTYLKNSQLHLLFYIYKYITIFSGQKYHFLSILNG